MDNNNADNNAADTEEGRAQEGTQGAYYNPRCGIDTAQAFFSSRVSGDPVVLTLSCLSHRPTGRTPDPRVEVEEVRGLTGPR